MLFIIALAAATVVGLAMWKIMNGPPERPTERTEERAPAPPRMRAPDDDPEFLRALGERLRREGEGPSGRR